MPTVSRFDALVFGLSKVDRTTLNSRLEQLGIGRPWIKVRELKTFQQLPFVIEQQ